MRAELKSELPADDTLMTGLQQIDHSGQRAASLTRQLLAFSRRQTVNPEILDPNRLLVDVESILRRFLDARIVMELKLEPSLHRVRADGGQIEQALMNLVVNARDAMPNGGRLTIQTANVVLDDKQCGEHAGARPGPHVLLTVSDSGCGMDEATRQRIFEPFFTTKPLGQGTGLGLSTVYGIIKQSNGYITAESEPGRGTVFKIYLPAVDAEADDAIVSSADEEAFAGSETVLVCEDEEVVRTLACRILERSGYTVLSAENGTRGLEVAEAHDGAIDILVTDVIMPEIDGVKLAETLRETRPDLNVLYISGYAPNTIANEVAISERAVFLEKPFSLRTLLERVREVLDQAKQ
jgi:CheY-like chemotaxis protein